MNRRKSITLAILVVLLLTFAVSGTIAYITTKTDPVENVFTPATVDTDIDEPGFTPGTSTQKETIKVVNNGNIPVFVRVAIVGNWVLDGKIVDSATISFKLGTDWVYNEADGYYYYTKAVPAGESTYDLLGSDITSATREDGAHLEVTVIHQSIQADGLGDGVDTAQEAFTTANSTTSSN